MDVRKPPLWSPKDLLMYIVPAAMTIMVGVGLYLNNRPEVETAPLPAQLLAVVVLILAWLGLVPVYVHRIFWRKQIKFITKHGLLVMWKDDKYAVKQEEVEAVTQKCHDDWLQSNILRKEIPSDKERSDLIMQAFAGNMVLFREHPFPLHQRYGLGRRMLAGLHEGEFLQVGLNGPVERTALHHELGHDILDDVLKIPGGTRSKDPMDDPHHKIMKAEGLL